MLIKVGEGYRVRWLAVYQVSITGQEPCAMDEKPVVRFPVYKSIGRRRQHGAISRHINRIAAWTKTDEPVIHHCFFSAIAYRTKMRRRGIRALRKIQREIPCFRDVTTDVAHQQNVA